MNEATRTRTETRQFGWGLREHVPIRVVRGRTREMAVRRSAVENYSTCCIASTHPDGALPLPEHITAVSYWYGWLFSIYTHAGRHQRPHPCCACSIAAQRNVFRVLHNDQQGLIHPPIALVIVVVHRTFSWSKPNPMVITHRHENVNMAKIVAAFVPW